MFNQSNNQINYLTNQHQYLSINKSNDSEKSNELNEFNKSNNMKKIKKPIVYDHFEPINLFRPILSTQSNDDLEYLEREEQYSRKRKRITINRNDPYEMMRVFLDEYVSKQYKTMSDEEEYQLVSMKIIHDQLQMKINKEKYSILYDTKIVPWNSSYSFMFQNQNILLSCILNDHVIVGLFYSNDSNHLNEINKFIFISIDSHISIIDCKNEMIVNSDKIQLDGFIFNCQTEYQSIILDEQMMNEFEFLKSMTGINNTIEVKRFIISQWKNDNHMILNDMIFQSMIEENAFENKSKENDNNSFENNNHKLKDIFG